MENVIQTGYVRLIISLFPLPNQMYTEIFIVKQNVLDSL